MEGGLSGARPGHPRVARAPLIEKEGGKPMSKLAIPDALWTQHVAVLAKPGRGKTVTAKGGAARMMKQNLRVGVVDPSAAWWGMRLQADGVTPAFPMVIFGGDHADIQITPAMGEKIGVLTGNADFSWIIDTSTMGKDARTEFFIGFAEAIFATNRRRLNLFLDECHLFIPQQHAGGRSAKHMLAVGNNLIAGGRGRGFCVTMISQRPAKVHKDSLTATESLIVLGMIAPQDVSAVSNWVNVQGDSETAREMISSLPALPVGEGWVYAPSLDLLQRSRFPMIETFDSSAAPSAKGDIRAPASLGDIDLDVIRSQLSPPRKLPAAAAPSKSSGSILKTVNASAARADDAQGMAALRDREAAFKAGIKEGERLAAERLPAFLDAQHADSYAIGWDARSQFFASATLAMLSEDAERLAAAIKTRIVSAKRDRFDDEIPPRRPLAKGAIPKASPSGTATLAPPPLAPPRAAPSPRASAAAPASAEGLSKPQAHLMRALAWWKAMGHERVSRAQLAAICGWKLGGSNMRGRLGELSAMGLISYPDTKSVVMTSAGDEIAPEPDTQQSLIESIRAMLDPPQLKLFDQLEIGVTHSRETIAGRIGWETKGSNMRGRLGELSALELIEYPTREEVRLQDWVQ